MIGTVLIYVMVTIGKISSFKDESTGRTGLSWTAVLLIVEIAPSIRLGIRFLEIRGAFPQIYRNTSFVISCTCSAPRCKTTTKGFFATFISIWPTLKKIQDPPVIPLT